ncbi:MAG TPA: YeeE/YedE thiosulfate transporter family protein [Gemmatimonadaceae bacterium]|nr:YeeE/YedE thiosulfate transporter family protein [Gemmatimonadaceae bacterium]
MSAPLPLAESSSAPAMLVALSIGLAFGWCLERSGLGSARKLMGQFQLTDLTVFKVMFTAIVTAMLGLFWLSWLGVLDLDRVYLPETFLVPQLAGGVIFGAGMALAGLCPGTSCVAAVTGRVDGLTVVAGFFIGVLGSGVLLPSMQRFYLSTPRGGYTLATLFGVPQGVVVAAIAAIALAGFVAAERVERWRATRAAEVTS